MVEAPHGAPGHCIRLLESLNARLVLRNDRFPGLPRMRLSRTGAR